MMANDTDSDDDLDLPNDPDLVILTASEILKKGLRMLRYSERQIDGWKHDIACQKFRNHYGGNPHVIAQIWEDLQTTDIAEAKLGSGTKFRSVENFLMALHFLKRYDTESERESRWQFSDRYLRDTGWYYVQKIQALKAYKIVWDAGEGNDIWILTVDGTSSIINEPTHPEFSQDRKAFSKKKQHAGYTYELGISLVKPKLIWMNGPFKSGANDKTNFVNEGLKDKLMAEGKKALGDKIYNGHPNEVSTFNAFDNDRVKALKARAQMRHEKFNGMVKEYESVNVQYRHRTIEKFASCFEAVCVICQYRMDHGEPLYSLLAGI